MAVVDEDDEAARQALRRVADPVDGAEVDLDAPAGFERDAEPIQMGLQGRRRQRSLDRPQSGTRLRRPGAFFTSCLRVFVADGGGDVYLAAAILAHDHLMPRKRIEQLVGDENA